MLYMGIFNNLTKLSGKNIQRMDTTFEIIAADYEIKDELLNYYNKLVPIVATNPLDMGGNRITSLADPTEDTDAINRIFLNKRISTANKNLKNEIQKETNTSIAELTKTNNDKVTDLETRITNGATALSAIQKTISDYIKSITDTHTELNKKDTLTAEEIKSINNKLTTELNNVETKMNEFNKMFIDTEELQSEISKLRTSLINSLTNKDVSDAAVVKTDITNIKSSNDDIVKKINDIKIEIANLKGKAKEDRTAIIETNFNNANTKLTAKDEELKRDITALQELIKEINKKTDELNIINLRLDTKDKELNNEIVDIKEYNGKLDQRVKIIQNLITKDKLDEIRRNLQTFITMFEERITQTNKDLNDKHQNLKNVLFDENDRFKLVKILELEEVKKEITATNTKITNVESTSNNAIQNINKTLNDLSIKVPFFSKVANILATDQVEVVGTTTSDRTTTTYTMGRDGRIAHTHHNKDICYDILSRVVHNDNIRSFKAFGVYDKYFYVENDNILIPKVGLRFIKAGTYIIESNFKIKIIGGGVSIKKLYLNYIHNNTSYYDNNKKENIPVFDKNKDKDFEVQWRYYIRFDIKSNDTLDIKLCADSINVPYENIFESYTNSSIEIYYIDYLGLPQIVS